MIEVCAELICSSFTVFGSGAVAMQGCSAFWDSKCSAFGTVNPETLDLIDPKP